MFRRRFSCAKDAFRAAEQHKSLGLPTGFQDLMLISSLASFSTPTNYRSHTAWPWRYLPFPDHLPQILSIFLSVLAR
eukprot:568978-Pleurochrysis_carterae.AAC.1